MEAEEEIAAIAVVGGAKVDVVVEAEVGDRPRRDEETFMLSRNDHKTTIPRFCDISGVPDMHEFGWRGLLYNKIERGAGDTAVKRLSVWAHFDGAWNSYGYRTKPHVTTQMASTVNSMSPKGLTCQLKQCPRSFIRRLLLEIELE